MKRPRFLSVVKVFQSPLSSSKGVLIAGAIRMPCALGRAGSTYFKREGDGKTPLGIFRLHQLWWRDDRFMRPQCGLAMRRIRKADGWCDDVRSTRYNHAIHKPCFFSHETMRREDHIYDFVIEIGYNMHPVKKGRGSAIFLHLARNNFEPTAGCVGVPQTSARRLLKLIGRHTQIKIL